MQHPLTFLAALLLATPAAAQVGLQGATYYPASDCAGCPPVHTSLIVDYTVAADLEPGGELRVFLGYLWEGRAILDPRRTDWSGMQVSDPQAAGWCRVSEATNADFDLVELDGPPFGFGLVPSNAANPVRAGDIFRFEIGDVSGGGPGYQVSPRASSIRIVVQERAGAAAPWVTPYPEPAYPRLEVGGAQATRFRVVAESLPINKNAIRVRVAALEGDDAFLINSPEVKTYTGTVHFSASVPGLALPPDTAFLPGDEGVKEFVVGMPLRRDFTITVHDVNDPSVTGTSNPVMVVPTFSPLAELRPYWGSLHNHTALGGHGLETPDMAYDYARRYGGLDFFSLTEHSSALMSNGMFDWPALRGLGAASTEEGRFIGFAGYEWTNRNVGHRHVVFKNAEEIPFIASEVPSTGQNVVVKNVDRLLERLAGADAIAIPHHTAWDDNGIYWGFSKKHSAQPLVEIYSWHGSSEQFGSELPIHGSANETVHAGSRAWVHEALALGYRFGFTGDGDNHVARAGSSLGQVHTPLVRYSRMGITGVYAPSLTRDHVWDALLNRRTYATTGARILAWMWVDGHFVGEEFATRGPRDIEVLIRGSDTIDLVEVLDADRVIHSVSPMALEASFTFTDERLMPGTTHAYHVRARQIGQNHPEQVDPHWVWVSPVWVEEPPRRRPGPQPGR